jgi:putative oxidoreductase
MKTVGLLILRLTVGGLVAGHGAQKLFGWFEGAGIRGTSGWLESMGFRPGRPWAFLGGASEFVGGLLTMLGLLNPVGPLMAIGAMLMATFTAHRDKPIWVTKGGPELTITNSAALLAVALGGPGRASLDRALGVRIPRWLAIPGLALVTCAVYLGLRSTEAVRTRTEAARSEERTIEAPTDEEAEPWPGPDAEAPAAFAATNRPERPA